MSGRLADLRALERHCRRVYAETRSILLPVLLCILLTQLVWVGVYDCTITRNIFPYDSQDSFAEGFANAALAMTVIALISGVMIALAIYQFKKIVENWLALSCIAVSFVITGSIFQDGAARLLPQLDETSQFAIAGALTTAYGGGAVMAFFTKHLPAWFHQLYVISNCASIAAFYLSAIPGLTAWILLAAIVLWDIFAVLAPIGPLKIALERSGDYSSDILRYMMFTADGEDQNGNSSEVEKEQEESVARPTKRLSAGADKEIKDQLSSSGDSSSGDSSSGVESEDEDTTTSSGVSSSGDSSSSSIINNDVSAPVEEKNAREALNTGSHLGFGDFIFYSILVGRSMATGLLPALFSTLGVLVGLAYTLSIPHEQETRPALPISIAFGMICHFSTVALMGAVEFLHDAYFV